MAMATALSPALRALPLPSPSSSSSSSSFSLGSSPLCKTRDGGFRVASRTRLCFFSPGENGVFTIIASPGRRLASPVASLSTPKGFGSPDPKKPKKKPDSEKKTEVFQFESKPAPPEVVEDDSVPEQVTNRILKRIVFTVGIPLFIGLSTFPLFYWLKVIQKVDLPEWVPFITSIFCFGSAGLGISYGVISASWDPNREGTWLGWKEAKANWPVLMDSFSKRK